MNEQIRNLFKGHHRQHAGVELLTRGKALWVGHFVRNDELFVWRLQLVWPAVFQWQSKELVLQDLF